MVQIIDTAGREHEAILAEQDVVLIDPIGQGNVKVFAGHPIPGHLEEAYVKQVRPKRSPAKKKA